MKKLLDLIKKYDVDILIVVCLIAAKATFSMQMTYGDELWNFANAYKMFEGYKIYRDLNVIITPLFFYIAQMFFKVFGATILSFKIYNIFISSTLIMLVYKIFKNMKVVRIRAILYTVLITLVLSGLIEQGANYNLLVLIPIFINILLILKNKENDFLTGILLFLTFMLKQNIFIYFSIGILIYKIVTTKEIKTAIIQLTKIYITSILGIAVFFIYLYFDNNLYNFINYCFLGLAEFGTNNIYMDVFGGGYILIAIFSIVFNLFAINNRQIKSKLDDNLVKNIKIFLCFGVPLIFIAYPIFNQYHSMLASLILLICFMYSTEEMIIKELFKGNKKENMIYTIIIMGLMIYCIYTIGCVVSVIHNKKYSFNKNYPFFGYITDEEVKNDIEIICDYIEKNKDNGIDVKVLSYKANMYMVPLGMNNGMFDLPNLGNFGKDGEEGLINQIKKLKNTRILIETEDKDMIGQISKKARQYIIDNYEKIGEIREYSIYEVGDKK